MDAVDRYRKRREKRLATRMDVEIWRTTDSGKHYAIETETGEITKGNIGQHSEKNKGIKPRPIPERLTEEDKGDIARKFYSSWTNIYTWRDLKKNPETTKKEETKARKVFRKEMRRIPEGTRIQIEDKGRYGNGGDVYTFVKRNGKFEGELRGDYHVNKEYKNLTPDKLSEMCVKMVKGKIKIMNKGVSKENIAKIEEEAKKNGTSVIKENGDMYIDFPDSVVFPPAFGREKYRAKVVDEPIGKYLGHMGNFSIYGTNREGKGKFGYEIKLERDNWWK